MTTRPDGHRCTVAIVGGGISGLSAALTILHGSDASVALFEKRGVGSNNPTPLVFSDVIQEFELDAHVTARYRRFTFHGPEGGRSSHAFQHSPLVALDYRGACLELLRRGLAAGRMTLIDGEAVRLSRGSDGAWAIGLQDGREFVASAIVDASGRDLFTARRLGLPRPGMYSHCFGQVFSGGSVPDPEEAFFLAPSRSFGDGGGWLYPLANGKVSFGYAALDSAPAYREEAKEGYARALREFRPYSDWLSAARPVCAEVGVIPIFPLRRFVHDGLVVVGDAAGQATPWACMGIAMALIGGQMAGQSVGDACRRGDFTAATLNRYQRLWDDSYQRIYRQATLLAPLIWRSEGIDWNRHLSLMQRLTPEQMLSRLRTNWPLLPLWKILFIRAYDWAGRMRRSLRRCPSRPNREPAS